MGWSPFFAQSLGAFYLVVASGWQAFAAPPAGQNGDKKVASPAASLTLEALLAAVEAQYPSLAGAKQDQTKADADTLASEGGFDPVLRSSLQAVPAGEYENRALDLALEQPTALWGTKLYTGYRLGRGAFGPYDEKLLTNSGGELRAGIEVPLLRGGAIDERRVRLASADFGRETAQLSLRSQWLEARRLATQRYFDWLAAGEKLKIVEGLLVLAKTRDEAMHLRVRKGDAAAIDQVDNERSVLQREATLVSARRAFNKAALELSLFYRDGSGQPILVGPEQLPSGGWAPPVDAPARGVSPALTVTADVVDQHPDVQRLTAQIKQTELDVRLARNGLLPKLDLDLGTSKDMGDGSEKKARLEYKIGLKMELPLLQRTPRGRLGGALATASKLQIQQAFTKDRLRTALVDGQQSVAAARDRLALVQKEVDLAAKVEKAEQVRWSHGDSNLLMVNLREQATADARARLVDTMLEYRKALADVEAIIAYDARRPP